MKIFFKRLLAVLLLLVVFIGVWILVSALWSDAMQKTDFKNFEFHPTSYYTKDAFMQTSFVILPLYLYACYKLIKSAK